MILLPKTIGRRRKDVRSTSKTLGLLLLIAFSLIIFSLLRDGYLLFRYPVAVGIDGYYYVLQIENLESKGVLLFKTVTPACMYFLALLRFVLGDSAVALKTGGLILHLLLSAGVYALLRELTKETFYALCGLILVVASSVHLFMVSEFINNLAAIAMLVWSAYLLLLAERTAHPMAILGAVLCALLAILSHRSAIFLIMALFGSTVLYHWSNAPNVTTYKKAVLGIVALALLLSPRFIGAQSLFTLPVWISSAVIAPSRLMTLGRIAVPEKILLLMAATLSLFVVRKGGLSQTSRGSAVGGLAVMSLMLTLNPFLNRDAGWLSIAERVSAFAYVQAAILLPSLCCFSTVGFRKTAKQLCLILVICFAAISFLLPLPFGLQKDYLLQRSSLIGDLTRQRSALSDVQRVIAPHGDQFVVTYALGVPAQHEWASTNEPGTYWLLQQVSADTKDISGGLIVLNEERGTLLVRDDKLDSLLNRMPGWRDSLPVNPHLIQRLLHQHSEQATQLATTK